MKNVGQRLRWVCLIIAERFGWLHHVPQEDIEWARLRNELRRFEFGPEAYRKAYRELLIAIKAFPGYIPQKPEDIDVIIEFIFQQRLEPEDFSLLKNVMINIESGSRFMGLDSVRANILAILSALYTVSGEPQKAVEHYLMVLGINAQLELRGERPVNMDRLADVLLPKYVIKTRDWTHAQA